MDQLARDVAGRVQAPVEAALGTEGSPEANLDAGVTALHAAIEVCLSTVHATSGWLCFQHAWAWLAARSLTATWQCSTMAPPPV